MKTIVKVLLISLIGLVLSQCKKETEPLIPDNNFLNALIENGVDNNNDGIISPKEAEAIISLYVRECRIADMKGIEAFVNLENLDCSDNQLTTLNISNNIALTGLACYSNQLTSLDVSNNKALTSLACGWNPLTALEVSNNTALTSLFVFRCQLTSLDVSNNTALEILQCAYNMLTTLNVSNNTALTTLGCGSNSLTALDVSYNTSLGDLQLLFMPSLQKVCVWTMPFPPAGITVDTTSGPNVYFTTDCSK